MSYVDHRVPARVLGGPTAGGAPYILGSLELGRINIAARAVGVARAALDAALPMRTSGGPSASRSPSTRRSSSSWPTWPPRSRPPGCSRNARAVRAAGERADVEAGMAKLFATKTALEVATEALRIHGGVGYTTELPIERYYRDAPLMIIGEGTNEIQRIVIAWTPQAFLSFVTSSPGS